MMAAVTSPFSGGLGSYDAIDPTAFVGALLGKAAGIFALSQIVFHSAQPTIAKVGETA